MSHIIGVNTLSKFIGMNLETNQYRELKFLADKFKILKQPRPQGLLAFQYGGGRREDPGTQQKSRDRFVHGEWKFIQNGGQDKE